jgi:hypothetical protein
LPIFFYGVFVRFSARGLKNTTKNFFGKIHVKKNKKIIAFLAVSLHEEHKNTIKYFKNQT